MTMLIKSCNEQVCSYMHTRLVLLNTPESVDLA